MLARVRIYIFLFAVCLAGAGERVVEQRAVLPP